jgi:hypothetical protein
MKSSVYGKLAAALFVLAIIFCRPAGAQQSSSFDELKTETIQLQQNPADDGLRTKIIQLAAGLDMKPATPPDMDELIGKAKFILSQANSDADYAAAGDAFVQASLLAPWVPENYSNAGVAYEKAKRYSDAIRFFQFYLLAAPNAPDAKAAREHIGGLQYAIQKAASDRAAAEAAAQQKQEAIRDLNGYWACQSGCNGYPTVSVSNGAFQMDIGDWSLQGTLDGGHISGTAVQAGWHDAHFNCNIPSANHPMTGTIRDDGTLILKTETTTYSWHGTWQGSLLFGGYQCDGVNPTNVGPLEFVLSGGGGKPYVGARLSDFTSDLAAKNPAGSDKSIQKQFRSCNKQGIASGGALVAQVMPESPASAAGLGAGDAVIDYQGQRLCRSSDLADAISSLSPGSEIQLRVLHADGRSERVSVQVGMQSNRAISASLRPDAQALANK